MAEVISENKSIPLRSSVLLSLAVNLFISVMTGWNFLGVRGNFPSWFGPVFLVAIGLFICIICFYIWQLPRTLELVKPPAGHAIMMWPEIPPHLNILKYNFILTAGSLLVVLILAVFYSLGRRIQAVTGLVILAIIMLVPNDK